VPPAWLIIYFEEKFHANPNGFKTAPASFAAHFGIFYGVRSGRDCARTLHEVPGSRAAANRLTALAANQVH
jgi:hypothetical protein